MEKQYTKAYIEDINDNDIIAVASTENEDRDGDVLRLDGWELENYRKAPRLLWGHDANKFPIGRVKKIWKTEGKLKFIPEFASDVNPEAAMIEKMVRHDPPYINTFSVGFIPKEQNEKGEWTKQELLEISLVNIPANQEAMVSDEYKAFQKSLKTIKKDTKKVEKWLEKKEVKEGKKEEKKEDKKVSEKKETPKEKVETPEEIKNMVRNAIDTCNQTVADLKGLLGNMKSKESTKDDVKKEKSTKKIQVTAKSQDIKRRKAAIIAQRSLEILLQSYKNERN